MLWYVLIAGGLSLPILFLVLVYLRWRARSARRRLTLLGALVGGLVPCLWLAWITIVEERGTLYDLIHALFLGAWLWVYGFTALGALVAALLGTLLVPRE